MTEDESQTLIDESLDRLLVEFPPDKTDPIEFLQAQFDAGLAYVWFPKGHGGLDGSVGAQSAVDERLRAIGAPLSGRVTNAIAAGQGAATILEYGSEAQKDRYLRALFTTEMMGCQLYSEPGAGSDLASLATRAIRDGDDWIVNGQKVWTSGAHRADMAILLARSDPDAPKHSGLTQFVLDMHASGVEVRPLRQMTGGTEFNEVFLTDVRIPDTERLGAINEGWTVSQHTLVYERYNMPQVHGRGEGAIGLAVAAWKERSDKSSPAAHALRQELMCHWVTLEVVRLQRLRTGVLRNLGSTGPEGSLSKLAASVAGRSLGEWAPRLLGSAGTLLEEGYVGAPSTPSGTAHRNLQMACVGSPGTGIAGGTDQIQRNIIGERVLGLPREPSLDRGVPWSKLLRN
jgi:alkylation response protein AidB-like acyl-CoA dehydrogenase